MSHASTKPTEASVQKVALVTGASSGIGEAIARRLDAEGYRVLCAQRRTAPVGETIALSLLDPDAVERLSAAVTATTHRLDVLVNNAGLERVTPIDDPDDAVIAIKSAELQHPRGSGEGGRRGLGRSGGRRRRRWR